MAAKWESQKKGFLDDSEWINRAKTITGNEEKSDDQSLNETTSDSKTLEQSPGNVPKIIMIKDSF